jgi:hypothetical protein
LAATHSLGKPVSPKSGSNIPEQPQSVGKNSQRKNREEQSTRDIEPDIPGDVHTINIDGSEHRAKANDELDQHSERQKSPAVHQSMFSIHERSGKQKIANRPGISRSVRN